MPDRRKHRGKHPEDERLFDAGAVGPLRAAVGDLSWLLTRGYALDASVKLVGDRYGLTARQRMAVRRCACADVDLAARRRKEVPADGLVGEPVGVDLYNLLITVESALSGGLIMVGRDGCYRDLASIHGTYRKVTETIPAVELIMAHLSECGVAAVNAYLDSPVSNSGRLKALIEERVARRPPGAGRADAVSAGAGGQPGWRVELAINPDDVLAAYEGVVASSDSNVLDRCGRWTNLAGAIVDRRVAGAWKIDLRPG